MDLFGRGTRAVPTDELTELREDIAQIGDAFRDVLYEREEMQESIAELELQLEDVGWLLLSHRLEDMEFSREGLDKLIRLSRLFWIKNPLIKQGVEVQNLYVWAQGVSIKAPDSTIDKVVQAFLADAANKDSVGSYRARKALERTRAVDGNVFFRFFVNDTTGRVVVRTINVDQIRDIATNPKDATQVFFYERRWREVDRAGGVGTEQTEYYPDWAYLRELEMKGEDRPTAPLKEGARVNWETPIYHLKAQCLDGMAFGIPETYVSLDWARAYKETLEDFKKTVKSLSKWAWQLKGGGGQAAVDAAVEKLNTMLSSFGYDTNPAPTSGSAFVAGKNTELEAVDVSNAYVDPTGFRPLLRMSLIGQGLPETFGGDVSAGNQATAETLDRPTELKFLDCQTMWRETLADIVTIAVEAAAKIPKRDGIVFRGYDPATGEMDLGTDVARGRLGRMVNVDFPPILQRDVAQQISALVRLVTLGNWPVQLLDDGPTLLRLGLTWLRVDNVEEIIEKFYPADGSEPEGLKPLPPYVPRQKAVGNNQTGGDAKPYGTAPRGSATQGQEEAAALEREIARLRAAIEAAAGGR